MTAMPSIAAPPQGAPVVNTPGPCPGDFTAQESISLRAWFGQDEASHGTIRYPVDNQGLVQVPPEAAGPLIARGGFALSKAKDAAFSSGSLRLHHDESRGCSYAGRQYPCDENGDVLVPAEAAFELLAHGFVAVPRGEISALKHKNRAPSHRSVKG